MKARQEKIREMARKLLECGEVDMFIGYSAGSEVMRTVPVFINRPEDADQLVFSPFCVNNLVKYLLDYRNIPGKIAICVKGCDSRAVNRLIQDNQLERERIVVLGIPCPGMLDENIVGEVVDSDARLLDVSMDKESFNLKTDRGNHILRRDRYLMEKCLRCQKNNPVVYDYLIGEELPQNGLEDQFSDVKKIDGLSVQEKSDYWDRQFSRCLRCYACRNVCPVCTCPECVFDQAQPGWVDRANNLSDNTAFHLVRAFHVAGRCVDCGECQRVCPVKIPISLLNRKILHDLKDLYGTPTPGLSPGDTPALGGFHTGDPEEFI